MRFIVLLAVITVQCFGYPDGHLPARQRSLDAPIIIHHDDSTVDHPMDPPMTEHLPQPLPMPLPPMPLPPMPLPPMVEPPMVGPPMFVPQRPEHGNDHHEHDLVGGIPLVAEFGTYPTEMIAPYPNMFLPMVPSFEPFPYDLPANHPLFGKPPGSLPLTPEVAEPY